MMADSNDIQPLDLSPLKELDPDRERRPRTSTHAETPDPLVDAYDRGYAAGAARLEEAEWLLYEAFAFTLDEAPPPFRTKLSTRIQRFLDGDNRRG